MKALISVNVRTVNPRRVARQVARVTLKPIYKMYERLLEKAVREGPIPEHVGIIMDGNRRFAREMGLDPWEGHRFGADKLEDVLEWCWDVGVRAVTVYALSTENLRRPKEELRRLFDLMEERFNKLAESERIHRREVAVRAVGRLHLLPDRVRRAIKRAEKLTREYSKRFLNVAVAYGGRQEIIDAVRAIAHDVKGGKLDPEDINEDTFRRYVYVGDLPDPELIIRTSGEERLSNFLLWYSAYSELYFVDVYWPEFRKIDLLRAIREFQRRERRFGK